MGDVSPLISQRRDSHEGSAEMFLLCLLASSFWFYDGLLIIYYNWIIFNSRRYNFLKYNEMFIKLSSTGLIDQLFISNESFIRSTSCWHYRDNRVFKHHFWIDSKYFGWISSFILQSSKTLLIENINVKWNTGLMLTFKFWLLFTPFIYPSNSQNQTMHMHNNLTFLRISFSLATLDFLNLNPSKIRKRKNELNSFQKFHELERIFIHVHFICV